MVERRREGGRCDYCLVGSQKNRSAQKYVVRERGTVSDIINTLETYSEKALARPRTRSHVNTHTCVHNTLVCIQNCRCVPPPPTPKKTKKSKKQPVVVNINSYKDT